MILNFTGQKVNVAKIRRKLAYVTVFVHAYRRVWFVFRNFEGWQQLTVIWGRLSGTKWLKRRSFIRMVCLFFPLPSNICDVILKREIKLWRCQQAQEEYLTLSPPFTSALTPSGIQFKLNKGSSFPVWLGKVKCITGCTSSWFPFSRQHQ